jgi:hypothetical protein
VVSGLLLFNTLPQFRRSFYRLLTPGSQADSVESSQAKRRPPPEGAARHTVFLQQFKDGSLDRHDVTAGDEGWVGLAERKASGTQLPGSALSPAERRA